MQDYCFTPYQRWLGGLLIALLIPNFAINAQPTPPDPLQILQTYYHAINMGDYGRAYELRLDTTQPFSDFVTGFEQTQHIRPYFGAFQTGAEGAGRVPAVLVAQQDSGAIQVFAGCFFMEVRVATGSRVWRIVGNTLQDLNATARPAFSTMTNYLDTVDCFGAPTARVAYDPNILRFPTQAEQLVHQYYTAINIDAFSPAYSMWLFPLPGTQPNGAPAQLYRPEFSNFVAGFDTTRFISVYTNGYLFEGAAAGRSYLDGFLPVVFVAEAANSAFTTFGGCFAMGRFVDGRMGIINGSFSILVDRVPTATEIAEALQLDCTTLGIEL